MGEERRIAIFFSPQIEGNKMRVVEKAEGGSTPRRYLYGISSGLKVDGAGERMTQKAIDSFHRQAESGDVLLYSGKHGVDFTDDVGKLVESRITPEGEWMTGYRLYDTADGFDPNSPTIHKADKLWRQINGLPPYAYPRKKGFSVEGVIPENGGIAQMDSMGRRAMDDVALDGVLVCTRPAYASSVAQAVYKALGIQTIQDQKNAFRNALAVNKDADNYYTQRIILDGELENQVAAIIRKSAPEREDELRTLFEAYRDHMVGLIMRSESVFKDDLSNEGSGLGRAMNGPSREGNQIVALSKLAVVLASRLRASGPSGGLT
jgi:hypothetical protein